MGVPTAECAEAVLSVPCADTIIPAAADKSEGVFNALLMPAERYPASPASAHLITAGHWRICGENEIFDKGKIDGFSLKMVESVRRMVKSALGILCVWRKIANFLMMVRF